MAKNNLAGAWGEAQAAEHLRKKHYEIVAAGYRSRFGEIDLIVRNRNYLVFVEVKLRKSQSFAQAKEFVDLRKEERIRITADFYLSQTYISHHSRCSKIKCPFLNLEMNLLETTCLHLFD